MVCLLFQFQRLQLMSRIVVLPVLHLHLQRLLQQQRQASLQLQLLLLPKLQDRLPPLLQPLCKRARACALEACRLLLR